MAHCEAVVVLFLLCLSDVVVNVLEEVVDLLVLPRVQGVEALLLALAQFAQVLVRLDAVAQEERVVRRCGREGGEVAERGEGRTGAGRERGGARACFECRCREVRRVV